ncbi:MAG TPA: LysM peptidoglycan-binding domain-containing protein [Clostridiales bacterium]|nr:LysM peptidoglycan-binding domain-containing protein [Clostridiales bacterium]
MNYIVQPGESIYLLARRFNTSVEAIMSANNLPHPEYTYPGQLLNIPVYSRPYDAGKEYIVQPGESLYDIAVRHNVPLRELIQINCITAPYIVYAGQSLVLPEIPSS